MGGLFDWVEEFGDPVVVSGGLGESFCDDGGLGEFNPESEVDYWVVETAEHSLQEIFRVWGAREQVLEEGVLPSLGGDFVGEEREVVVEVLLFTEEGFEFVGVTHLLDVSIRDRLLRFLIVVVVVEASLDF